MDVSYFSGLYTRLKDKDLPLTSKLQLLRFSWKSDEVLIPNKEQVLIDMLTGYLLNKKKYSVTDEEVSSIWKCLHDVLRTQKAHLAIKLGQGLIIKQSICQIILDALGSAVSQDEDCPYLDSMIGCCQSLITSPTLSYIFTARLDQMLSLIGTVCSLLVKHAEIDDVRDILIVLLKEAAKSYLKAQKTAPNQKQILQWGCTKLLPSFLHLRSVASDKHLLTDTIKCLCDVIQQTFFHKDHHEGYEIYLNKKYGSESSRKPVRVIEQVFTTIQSALKVKTWSGNDTYLFIPVLYEGFLKTNCHNSNPTVAHHMIMECCNLIGLRHDSTALSGSADLAVVIKGVNQLLKTLQRSEVYSVSADEKGTQLQFFRHLVAVLLENNCFTADWFSCFTVLLQLNHQILEPSLQDILLNTWLNLENQLSESSTKALDEFLQELVTTYQKLRLFQKFMVKLLATLATCGCQQYICMPPGFIKRYGEVVQSLPQGMTVDIWKLFVQHLKQHHVTTDNTGHFQGVCALFCEFLSNVKIADYSTTELTSSAVHDLVVTMETDILAPLLQRFIVDKMEAQQMLLPTLHLCHSVGELTLMLAQYTRYRIDTFMTQKVDHTASSLSYVHSYLSPKDWMKLHRLISQSNDRKLFHIWDMLELQQFRAQLLFTDSNVVTMATVFDLPAEVSSEDLTASWNLSVYDVDNNNCLVAKWHLLVSNMSALYKILTPEQCFNIAGFMVQTAAYGDNMIRYLPCPFSCLIGSDVTLGNITDSLLKAPWMSEFSTMQSAFITATWGRIGNCFSAKLKSGKKRKSSSSSTDLHSVLNYLGDNDTQWQGGLNSETAAVLQTTAGVVNRVLEAEEQHSSIILDCDLLNKYLQIPHQLPLEHLSPCDQLRCLLGLLSLTAYITTCSQEKESRTSPEIMIQNEAGHSQSEARSQNEAVLNSCLQLMMVIIESSGTASVFQLLELQTCLQWLQRLQKLPVCKTPRSVNLRVLMFVEMCCVSMVTDYQMLEKIPSVLPQPGICVQQPVSDVSQAALFMSSCFLQALSKFLNRPYLKDSLKSICSEIFVSMATALVKNVKVIVSEGHSTASDHVIKCLTTIIATNLGSEVKDQMMSSVLKWLDEILDWCLRAMQQGGEDYTKLIALTCMLVISKHHKELEDKLSPSKKLECWTKLVEFLQMLLSGETNPPSKEELQNHSASNMSHDKDDQSDSRNAFTSRDDFSYDKLENIVLSSVQDTSSVVDILKLLMEEKCSHSDMATTLRTSEIKLPTHNQRYSTSANSQDISASSVNSMYRTLVYEGNWETQSSKVILVQVQSVLATMVMSFDLVEFTKVVQGIVEDVSSQALYSNAKKLQCSLYIWQRLLKLQLSHEQAAVIVGAAQNLMLNLQSIVQQLSHTDDDRLLLTVAVPVMRAQEQMLSLGQVLYAILPPSLGQSFMSPQTSVLCLHSCLLLPLGGSSYFPAFHACCSVLDTLLMNHTETVLKTIPSYLSCAKRLLLSVVLFSSQENISGDKDTIGSLVDCSHQMERLFTQISSHKVDFSKVAVYVVSDYVTAVQKVTLVPAIKRALVPAVYKMLDLCDKHSIAQLHTVLSHGVCEVFKLLYSDYNKYYRYTGKI